MCIAASVFESMALEERRLLDTDDSSPMTAPSTPTRVRDGRPWWDGVNVNEETGGLFDATALRIFCSQRSVLLCPLLYRCICSIFVFSFLTLLAGNRRI